jgi:hypothetical protein
MRMPVGSQVDALRYLAEVRWPLLESFALARQEGLNDPIGVVIDSEFAYAQGLARTLLVANELSGSPRRSVTCMESGTLGSWLSGVAPEVARALRARSDEPGRFTVVLVADRAWVLTGNWQELFTMQPSQQQMQTASRSARPRSRK